jgi:hypothetical protein
MKRVLMVFGCAFIALFAGIGFLGIQALRTAGQNQDAAVAAVRAISKDWSLQTNAQHVAPALLRIARKPNIRQAFHHFRTYGPLDKAEHASQTNYAISTTSGTTAVVEFVGHFKNGIAKLTVKLHEIQGQMKMIGLRMKHMAASRPAREERA